MGVIKDGLFQLVSGGSAGFVEVCIMQPLDLVKTRLQVQRGHGAARQYTGIADCFVKVCRQEGVLSLYKGILAPIAAETPKRATKFFTFEQYKSLFSSFGGGASTPLTFSMAGLCCGATEAVVVNTFEAVKVRLQADNLVTFSEQRSAYQTARVLIAEGGYGTAGLNRGLTACVTRNGIWNMIYFGFYHSVKPYLGTDQEFKSNYAYRLGLGFAAGSLGCVGNTPFDVIKTRIQASQGKLTKYKHCFPSLVMVYREEGARALYKGLLPKMMRLGPGGAVLMVIYEHVYEFLKTNFD